MVKNTIRALRLPFISASVLPFIFGSLISRQDFNFWAFLAGFIAVASTHLSANLINDYADSRSGADWQDKKFYGFFGGSKLIQENVLPEVYFLRLSLFFATLALCAVVGLSLILKDTMVITLFLFIIALSWQYSAKPLQFSYRRLGELFIFLLFGPALVMGGYFIQTGIFPDLKSFLLSLPFGILTTAILFVNEVPDLPEDKKSRKFTWVSIVGARKAYIFYLILIFSAFMLILFCVSRNYLKPFSLLVFLFAFPAFKAAMNLKRNPGNKMKLLESSRLTVLIQSLVSIILILGVL